jgi:putative membrane protein
VSTGELPLANAALNTLTTVLLVAGYAAIKSGRRDLHRNLMVAAFGTSMLFLAGYLAHKFFHGTTRFTAQGWPRPVYFTILLTHTILAVVNLPLILRLLYLAVRGRFEAHRRLARWVWPVWMYVSVTGVVVYLFLYHWFPPG